MELWDLIVSILGNDSRVSDRSEKLGNDVHKRDKSQQNIDVIQMLFLQTSNPRVKKLYCMCLKTMKQ